MTEMHKALQLKIGDELKPNSLRRQWQKKASYAFDAIFVMWILTVLFPQIICHNRVVSNGVVIYTSQPVVQGDVDRVTRSASALLQKSSFHRDEGTPNVFILNSQWGFSLFALWRTPFAVTLPGIHNVIIASGDFPSDTAFAFHKDYARRSLSGVIAHEITHVDMKKSLGPWTYFRLHNWIEEGYCDYVAQSGSVPDSDGIPAILDGRAQTEPWFRYFAYRKMIEFSIENRKLSIEKIIETNNTGEKEFDLVRQFFVNSSKTE